LMAVPQTRRHEQSGNGHSDSILVVTEFSPL